MHRYLILYEYTRPKANRPGQWHPRAIFGRWPYRALFNLRRHAEEAPGEVRNVELFERRGDTWAKVDDLEHPPD